MVRGRRATAWVELRIEASGYGASRAMGQVGKECFGTVETNQPFFFQTRGMGRVREKMAYFRQRYW